MCRITTIFCDKWRGNRTRTPAYFYFKIYVIVEGTLKRYGGQNQRSSLSSFITAVLDALPGGNFTAYYYFIYLILYVARVGHYVASPGRTFGLFAVKRYYLKGSKQNKPNKENPKYRTNKYLEDLGWSLNVHPLKQGISWTVTLVLLNFRTIHIESLRK